MSKNMASLLPGLTDDELSWLEYVLTYKNVACGAILNKANYVLVDAEKVLRRLREASPTSVRWKPSRDSLKQKIIDHLYEGGHGASETEEFSPSSP